MNATAYVLGILLQAVAAFIALAQVRISPKKLPWLFIAVSSLLIVFRRAAALRQALSGRQELAFAEVITLLVSLFFFFGVILMTRPFRVTAGMQEALQQSEAGLRERDARLTESNQLLNSILEHTHVQAVYLDPRFNFIWVNRAYAETCRQPKSFFPGKNHFALYPHPGNQAIFQRVVDSGEPFFVAARPFEFPDQPERGVTFWDWSLVPVKGADSRVAGLVFTLADVTARVQMETALRESREEFLSAFAHAAIGIALVSPGGAFLKVNQALCDMVGYTSEELTALTFQQITHPDDLAADLDHVRRLLAGETATYQMEKRYIGKPGNVVWAQLNVSLLRDGGGRPRFFISQIQDIGARKRAEAERLLHREQLQQAEKLATLGILVAGVAHEINNPNNFIMLNSDIFAQVWRDAAALLEERFAARGDFPLGGMPYSVARERIPGLLQGLLDGSGRIRAIVADLKEYAAPEPGTAQSPADVNGAVRAAAQLTGNLVQQSTSRFCLDLADGTLPVLGSAQKLEQLFINLIQNACQALTDSGQAIEVTSRLDRAAGQVRVTVRDEGRGLAAGELAHIADPFFTTRRGDGGTGLGIPICQRIVGDLGGSLRFDSADGRGMVVTVSLPVAG